eukprot:Selendium_serpulae@DN4925_c0_g1_i2.p1
MDKSCIWVSCYLRPMSPDGLWVSCICMLNRGLVSLEKLSKLGVERQINSVVHEAHVIAVWRRIFLGYGWCATPICDCEIRPLTQSWDRSNSQSFVRHPGMPNFIPKSNNSSLLLTVAVQPHFDRQQRSGIS